MSDVKSCSYCDKGNMAIPVRGDNGRYYLCYHCGAQGPNENTEAEALAAWNRRSAPALPDEVCDRLIHCDPACTLLGGNGALVDIPASWTVLSPVRTRHGVSATWENFATLALAREVVRGALMGGTNATH